ncbi:MAG: transketolase [Dehalococcoidia bacterium]|nr:transketolase [Dehalococcoidia bacterium]
MEKPEDIARNIRKALLTMIRQAGSGHPGGSLSCVEILTCLYFQEMNIRHENPVWMDRDRFVLSKGHACPALYSTLALKGFFPMDELDNFRQIGCRLQGHPDATIPGIEAVSGSLGMGLSQGIGMALGAKCLKSGFRVYVLLGDGDMEEGNTWEAIMAAGRFGLDNLVAILDSNEFQGDGPVASQMDYNPVGEKVSAFHWRFLQIDGHDFKQIEDAFREARNNRGKPTFIQAHTVKGKGISFMERDNSWHGSRGLTDQEYARAMLELGEPVL